MIMTAQPNYKTLVDLIRDNYSDYEIAFTNVAIDTDITHGVEIETIDNSKWGRGITVHIFPHVLWSDGLYKPCRFYGGGYSITLKKN